MGPVSIISLVGGAEGLAVYLTINNYWNHIIPKMEFWDPQREVFFVFQERKEVEPWRRNILSCAA